MRRAVILVLALKMLLLGCSSDPDPCDPDCPPTNCGETSEECALPETPAATSAVVIEEPTALDMFNHTLADLEKGKGWRFGRLERGIMHAGCWPDYYSEFDPADLPDGVNEMLADPWCIIGDIIPQPGPSIGQATEVPQ